MLIFKFFGSVNEIICLISKNLNIIISSCLNDESKGQNKLYQYCYEKFYPTCRRYIKDEERARETLNLAFHKVLINLSKYDVNRSFDAWANRIMVTTSIDEYRKEKRNMTTQLSNVVNYYRSQNEIEESIDEQSVLYLLDFLPPMGKQVFNLYAIDGYKHKEIAEMLSISESTSKWHVTESRKKLKELFKKNLMTVAS